MSDVKQQTGPKPGDRFRHVETGTVAVFHDWCQGVHGQPLMVLHHPKFGVCRWDPRRATPYRGEALP